MFLAEKTVKNYVSALFAKLGMERRTQAAAYAARIFDDRPASPRPPASSCRSRPCSAARICQALRLGQGADVRLCCPGAVAKPASRRSGRRPCQGHRAGETERQ